MLHPRVIVQKVFAPRSEDEDWARREFILNVLLVPIICLAFLSFSINLIDWFWRDTPAISPLGTFIPFVIFVGLYFLSKRGFVLSASSLLLVLFFALTTYMAYFWGTELPTALLTYALVIVMSGVLIGARAAFVATLTTAMTLLAVNALHQSGKVIADTYWKNEAWEFTDTIVVVVLLLIIATVSWLSNREIEKSLDRAKKSEAELKIERDSLELILDERTKELKEAQAQKMAQLYKFAEFGRLSAGLFHDLINPLNAVLLSMEKLKKGALGTSGDSGTLNEPITDGSKHVERAVRAAKKLEGLVVSIRRQMTREENKSVFSPKQETGHVLEMLSHKAMRAHVSLRLDAEEEIEMFGDAIKFNQVILNLVANAIDAYADDASTGNRVAVVAIRKEGREVVLEVRDWGVGVPEEYKNEIFQPFFTTKKDGQGIGIGLSITKRIVEKDFGGSISFHSGIGKGSVFTVSIPQFTKKQLNTTHSTHV